jgi:hypothetical protein
VLSRKYLEYVLGPRFMLNPSACPAEDRCDSLRALNYVEGLVSALILNNCGH